MSIVQNSGLGSGKRARKANCSPIWPQYLSNLSSSVSDQRQSIVLRSMKQFEITVKDPFYSFSVYSNQVDVRTEAEAASTSP